MRRLVYCKPQRHKRNADACAAAQTSGRVTFQRPLNKCSGQRLQLHVADNFKHSCSQFGVVTWLEIHLLL